MPTKQGQKYSCVVYDYAGKADLSKGYTGSQKENWGLPGIFLEIIISNNSFKKQGCR